MIANKSRITALFLLLALLPIHGLCNETPAELRSLILEALHRNPGLQAMLHRTQAAAALHDQARASYAPTAGLRLSYTRTDNPPQVFMQQLNQRTLDMQDPAFDPNQADASSNVRGSLYLQYPIFDASRRGARAASALGQQMSLAHEKAARNQLIHTVTRLYYQVLEAQAVAAVQHASLQSLEESLRVARERFETGAVVKTDVLNLEVQAAQAQDNLIRARNGIQIAIAALNAAIGADIVPHEGLPEPNLTKDLPPPEPHQSSSNDRPEAQASALARESARQQVRAARGQRLPTMHAFGSIDWDSDRVQDFEQSYLAGAMLEWPWFRGGGTSAKIRESEAHLRTSEAEHQQLLLSLQLDLTQASLLMQEAWARLPLTDQTVKSAEEAVRITRAQYQEGASDIASLLVAEVALTESRMRQTTAHYDYRIARSNFNRAAGRLDSNGAHSSHSTQHTSPHGGNP